MKKCSRYEALFTFANEADFKKHLDECDCCRAEQDRMDRVSALIAEAAPAFKQRQTVTQSLKAASILFAVLIAGVSFNLHGEALSAEDLGFPVDSYGLIMVDG